MDVPSYPFSKDFIPNKLVGREQQFEETMLVLKPVFKGLGRVSFETPFYSGIKGGGKTAMLKLFCIEAESKGGKAYYIKCENQLSKTLCNFLIKNNVKLHKDKRYIPDTEFLEFIINDYEKNKWNFILLMFDDADKIKRKKGDLDPFLHSLYDNLLENTNIRFNFMFASRMDAGAFVKYLENSYDRLNLRPIVFSRYNANQLLNIILDRVKLVLREDQYDLNALKYIASSVARATGSAEDVIKLTYKAIEIADTKLTIEDAEKVVLEMKGLFWKERIIKLHPHAGLILYAMALSVYDTNPFSINKEFLEISQRIIKEKYRRLCEKYGVQALSDATIKYLMDELEENGFIERGLILHKGRMGKDRTIILKEKPQNILNGARNIDWKLFLS